jgi:hypothetical protein
LAVELAAAHPALVFRNPERLAQGRQREERGHFIAFFSSDLVRQAIDGWQYWVAHYEL